MGGCCFVCCATRVCTIENLADLPGKIIVCDSLNSGVDFYLRVVTEVLTDQVKFNVVGLFHVFVSKL